MVGKSAEHQNGYGVSTGKTIQSVHRYLGFTVRLVRELE